MVYPMNIALSKGNGDSALPKNEDFTLEDLRKLNEDGSIDILYDKITGIPRFIDGKFSTIKIISPEDALNSLGSVKSLLKMDDPTNEFHCIRIDSDEISNIFIMQQIYKCVEVLNKQLVVVTNKDGEPISLSGEYAPGLSLDVTPLLQENMARKILSEKRRTAKFEDSRLVIYVSAKSVPYLCWLFVLREKKEINNSAVLIDARTGNIVTEFPSSFPNTNPQFTEF
jgi:Zn-dependent metalloprotease